MFLRLRTPTAVCTTTAPPTTMATSKENVPLAPKTLPRRTSNARPAPPPQRPNKAANVSPAAGGGILRCACFRLPSRSKNKPLPSPPPPPPPPAMKPSSASHRGAVAPDVPGATHHQQSQRVTFRASASLTTWWPASPSAHADAPGVVVAEGSVAPRRASASAAPPRNASGGGGTPRASSSTSFSHWRRSVSSRVMPHGERASFSFHTSPASASSSCMSTPKIPQGCQQQG